MGGGGIFLIPNQQQILQCIAVSIEMAEGDLFGVGGGCFSLLPV